MNRAEILASIKALDLPKDSYLAFGSVPLAMAGIREAGDIDMFVTAELLEQKRAEGWQPIHKSDRDIPLGYDCFEIHDNWDFGKGYNPSLADLQTRAYTIEGIPFASLADVREWKVVSGRPKDIEDIRLIDEYLQQKSH